MKQTLLFFFASVLSIYSYAQVLTDSSLEASGPGGSPWSSTSTNFGTSLCDAAGCGTCGGPCVPNTGSWYAWFGGTSNAETGTISQTFNTAAAGNGFLTYYLKVPMKGSIGDTLSIQIDGTNISKTNTDDSIGAYQQVTLNVGQITMGSHDLTIRFEKLASTNSVNVLVDDIQLTIAGTVSIEEIDFSNGIQISNNMESGEIMVAYNLNENQTVRLAVTDITGKVVYINQLEDQQTNQHLIHSTGWSSGIYNITLTSEKGLTKTKKIVVQ